jgi:hypothetical protein
VPDWETGPVLDWLSGWGKMAVLDVSGRFWGNGRFCDKYPRLDVGPGLDFGPRFRIFWEKSGHGRDWVTG